MPKQPVYLVFGDDEYCVGRRAKELLDELVPEAERALGLEVIDGAVGTGDEAVSALRQTIEAIKTIGFFGSGKTIWLQDAAFFGSDRRVSDVEAVKHLVAALAELVKNGLPEGQKLIISTPKIPKTGSLYRAVKAHGSFFEFTISSKAYFSEGDALEKIRKESQRLGIEFSEGAMRAFMMKVGGDSRLIVSEINKLLCYKGGETNVTEEDVADITSIGRDREVWDLSDAFGDRDLKRALQVLQQLIFQGVSAVWLVTLLCSKIKEMEMMREAMDRKWVSVSDGYRANVNWRVSPEVDAMMGQIEKDIRKITPFRQGILARQAGNFSLAELRRAHYYALKARESIVTETVPEESILEVLILRLLPKKRKPSRAASA